MMSYIYRLDGIPTALVEKEEGGIFMVECPCGWSQSVDHDRRHRPTLPWLMRAFHRAIWRISYDVVRFRAHDTLRFHYEHCVEARVAVPSYAVLRGALDSISVIAAELDGFHADKCVRIGKIAHDALADEPSEVDRLRTALALAASCIKGGERWSATCDEVIGGALGS